MLQNIREMRAMGVRVVFDDFGMGFSSFHDLQEYPMDGLKLDKQLVDNMWTAQGRVLLAALVRTGHELGLTILAEGVEEERQLEVLRQLGGPDRAQAVMVGDRKHDILGARACGVESSGVEYGFAPERGLEEAGADHIVPTVEALRGLLWQLTE